MTPTPTPGPPPAPQLTADVLLPFLGNLLVALVVLLVALLLARLARSATLHALERTRADRWTAHLVGRLSFLGVFVIGLLVALGAFGIAWTTVVALAGVFGLAASLALQDVLKNFVAGIYLLVERPFRVGEEIKVKDFVGRVETIDVRTTALRTADGELAMVPNAILFAEIILNRGAGGREGANPDDEAPRA
jgi:small conductance mechanosensitive channel